LDLIFEFSMKKQKQFGVAIAITVLVLLSANASAQLYREPVAKPPQGLDPILTNVGVDQKLNSQVPLDTKFRDENGQPVVLKQYFDKPVILTLVYYTCPMLCSEVLNGTAASLKPVKFDVGKEFNVVTISIDPKDTPGTAMGKKKMMMARYGQHGAENGWHFLTGDKQNIDAVANAVGWKYAYDPRSGQYAHASAIMLLTPEGKVSRYFYGIEYSAKDIQFGIMDASQNKIGSVADQVALYCYHYDPATGKYGVAVMRLVRAAGLLTVALICGLIFVAVRREGDKKA
jgi:protein SCO1